MNTYITNYSLCDALLLTLKKFFGKIFERDR